MTGRIVHLFDMTPLWLIGFILVIAMAGAAALGWWFRRWPTGTDERQAAGQEGYIVSSVLGLLALLLGFTFSLAIDRYETRRVLVLEEANDIGTAYLRAQLLDAPYRDRVSKLLVAYTDNRIALGVERPGPERLTLTRQNDLLLTRLWAETVAAYPGIRQSEFAGTYIEAMNAVIDMDTARKVARSAHVPSTVFMLLIIYQIASAGVLGYVLSGRHGVAIATTLCLLFTLALMLIMDVDRPTSGGVVESQEPMLMLRESLAAQPPEIFDKLARIDDLPTPAR